MVVSGAAHFRAAAAVVAERRCSALLTSAAVTPSAAIRVGSRVTLISRLTPPTRDTWPTPLTACSSRAMRSSMNQESSVGDISGAETAKVISVPPVKSSASTRGGWMLRGRSARIWLTRASTSSFAFCRSVPISNWIIVRRHAQRDARLQ